MAIQLLIAGVVLAALVLGGVAQLLAVYHLIRCFAGQSPEQRWGPGSFGGLSLLWSRELSEMVLNHRNRFLRWEAIFLACAVILLAWDVFLRQPNTAAQSDAFRPALSAPAPSAPGRER